MSLFATGDKGQRYEIAAFGYPFEGATCVMGWCESRDAAVNMAVAALQAPGCSAITIRDRWKTPPRAANSDDPINLQGSGPAPIEPREG